MQNLRDDTRSQPDQLAIRIAHSQNMQIILRRLERVPPGEQPFGRLHGEGNANWCHSETRLVKSERFSITSIRDMGFPSLATIKRYLGIVKG